MLGYLSGIGANIFFSILASIFLFLMPVEPNDYGLSSGSFAYGIGFRSDNPPLAFHALSALIPAAVSRRCALLAAL